MLFMRSSPAARLVTVALFAVLAARLSPASPRRTKTPTPPTPSPAPTAAATPARAPRPGTLVPEQPYVGTPSADAASAYAGILKAKEAGATEEELLARVAKEAKRYSLSTFDMQKLRAAGVSPKVIEAMLRSGRTPVPAPSVTPAKSAPR
jgi:hypothetical protein